MSLVSILFKRQYRLNGRGKYSNHCPIFKPYFSPPSVFNSLNVERYYEFIDSAGNFDSPITSIINNNGKTFAANDVGDVVILNENFDNETMFNAHNCAIFDMKFRPNYSNQIITAGGDRCVTLWDLNRLPICLHSNLYQILYAHNGSVKSVSFHSPHVFMSCGRDGTIKLWDLRISLSSKPGPILAIPDAHIHVLPSVKSSPFPTVKSRRQNPVACLNKNKPYHPSNVVTCVEFHLTNNNYCYSSGIADNSIKVWDIRRSCRQFQCAITAAPIKIHTIKNTMTSSNSQGYSSLMLKHSDQGVSLYASCTNGNIYGFNNNSVDPDIVFTGRLSDCQTKISSFGDDYILSGSTTNCIYLWNCNYKKISTKEETEESYFIENRLPIYQLEYENDRQNLAIVTGDFLSQSIYCCSDPNILWKWSFKNQHNEIGSIPKCQPFSMPEYCDNYSEKIKVNLKCSSKFENIACKRSSSFGPLQTISNWLHLETKRFKTSNEEKNDLIEKVTPKNSNNNNTDINNENDENRSIITSKSTSHKSIINAKNSRLLKRRNSRRNLFSGNRKIREFFTPI